MHMEDHNTSGTPESEMPQSAQVAFNELKTLTLTPSERISIKNNVRHFVTEHPPRLSPLVRVRRVIHHTYERMGSRRSAPAWGILSSAFALLLVVGIGTLYVGDTRLPPDLSAPAESDATLMQIESGATSNVRAAMPAPENPAPVFEKREAAASGDTSAPADAAMSTMVISDVATTTASTTAQ